MQIRWWLAGVVTAALGMAGCAESPLSQMVPKGSVQVAGASAVRVGESADYVATYEGERRDAGEVTWLVNGIPGGNVALGTINASGTYAAPASLPTDPHVNITAMVAGATGSAGVELWNPVPAVFAVAARENGSLLELEVSGKNFVEGATLKLGGNPLAAKVVSATQITASVPSGAVQAGIAEVAVTNPAPGAASSEEILITLTRPTRPPRNSVRGTPSLPATMFDYVKYAVTDLPAQYTTALGNPAAADNTPGDNPITNAGATLGRVLFYDKRLSVNNAVSCGSCHQQANGFADPARLSVGFQGGSTGRHSMGLSNARYYARGRFFWDERAATLEAQVVQPIQDAVEMGMTLDALETKLAATEYYPALFQTAFGTPEVTRDRIAKALAQFVRAMVSYRSKYDSAFVNGTPNFQAAFTPSELRGLQLFGPGGGPGRTVQCDRCHGGTGFVAGLTHNTGLDAAITDPGAGQGRFKVPSLRNIAVRQRFMHDGRFTSLEDVVQFYNAGVQNNPGLSALLKNPDGTVTRLNLTAQEAADLVAFMNTLTDASFLTDPKFNDPFQ